MKQSNSYVRIAKVWSCMTYHVTSCVGIQGGSCNLITWQSIAHTSLYILYNVLIERCVTLKGGYVRHSRVEMCATQGWICGPFKGGDVRHSRVEMCATQGWICAPLKGGDVRHSRVEMCATQNRDVQMIWVGMAEVDMIRVGIAELYIVGVGMANVERGVTCGWGVCVFDACHQWVCTWKHMEAEVLRPNQYPNVIPGANLPVHP